jgi:hypothetical protein
MFGVQAGSEAIARSWGDLDHLCGRHPADRSNLQDRTLPVMGVLIDQGTMAA